MEIKGKICVVTGAGRGLGFQMAKLLAGQGALVYACDVSEESLKNPKEAGLETCVCNVSDEQSVKDMFQVVAEKSGGLDVLVNNAGITRDGLLLKIKDDSVRTMPLEDFRKVVDVNLIGTFLCAREASVLMARSGGGVIINISSVSRAGNFGQTNYSASKAGVDAMTVVWSKELARYNIRCAAIAPGYMNTEMVAAIKPEVLEKIKAQVPLGRLGEMKEISDTVRFIIENDFINGRVLEIDGGLRV